jgi:glycosyltransferase involved in cell wall biosynthesis
MSQSLRSDVSYAPTSCRHLIRSLAAEAGGPSYSVPRLSDAIRPHISSEVWALEGVADGPGRRAFAPSHNSVLRKCGVSSALGIAMRSAASGRDTVIHTHGIWLWPNIAPGQLKRRRPEGFTLVHSPRGMLGPAALATTAWLKWPLWNLAQRDALAAADLIHATADSELEEIRRAGMRNPVAVVPNGIDLPELERPVRTRPVRTILSLGRLHPKKGLDRLVRAWSTLAPSLPDWQVRIIGPAENNHDAELKALIASLGVSRITVEPPVYGKARWPMLTEAELFVLPTLNENFALTVAEALACETPVIATKGAPWAGLETERCGWWIDHGVAPLTDALRIAIQTSDAERSAMGKRGRAWMSRDFGWPGIGERMIAAYRWAAHRGDRPAWVHV